MIFIKKYHKLETILNIKKRISLKESIFQNPETSLKLFVREKD